MSTRIGWPGSISVACDQDLARFAFRDSGDAESVAVALVEALSAHHAALVYPQALGIVLAEAILKVESFDASNFPPPDEAVRLRWFALRSAAGEFLYAEQQRRDEHTRRLEGGEG